MLNNSADFGKKDPRNDDDAQSSYCVAPVETSSSQSAPASLVHPTHASRFDRFTATLSKTAESVQGDGDESETSATALNLPPPPTPPPAGAGGDTLTTAQTDTTATSSSSGGETRQAGDSGPLAVAVEDGGVVAGGGGGGEGGGEGVSAKRPSGKEWLRTHPHGTPPTMKLAIQFDQVLTQRVLAFHSEWLRDNLLSRDGGVGQRNSTEMLRAKGRSGEQRFRLAGGLESPQDENLPALNVITAIAGKFFQQAEAS
eukprot:jgi/Undpi1/2961/HiC_scaffold_14.g06338.m1